MSVQGVVTTGIYCVPSCSARPLPGHVVPYRSPAEAEAAGFRACLRCRPHRRAPEVPTGPELVCRAVHLITEGALDGRPEADLAAALGVSVRHLRRLFVEHVGTTPDQLARSHRTHFARRLLEDTDLSVTDIAWASGFGSLRQLNRASQQVFHAPPTELRARRRRGDPLPADGGLILRLPYRGALDWDALLDYFATRAIAGVEHVDGRHLPPHRSRSTASPASSSSAAGRRATSTSAPIWRTSAASSTSCERARQIFALDRDPAEANARSPASRCSRRPVRGAARAARARHLGPPRDRGARHRGPAGERAGRQHGHGPHRRASGASGAGLRRPRAHPHVPRPGHALAGRPLRDRHAGARAAAIKAFAAAVDKGDIPIDGRLPLDDLVAAITAVPGLGPWTASYLALRMGEGDAFPVADLGLRRASGRRRCTPLTTAALAERAERWRPHRAAAAVRLWMSRARRRPSDPSRRLPARPCFQ